VPPLLDPLTIPELTDRRWNGEATASAVAPLTASAAVPASGSGERLNMLMRERLELIAENERLTRALARHQACHRRLMDSYPLPIFSLDPEGLIHEANQAAADVAGRRVEQLRGAPLEQWIAPEDLSFVGDAFRATAGGQPSTGPLECRVIRPSGERRTLALTRTPIVEDGRVVGVQGVGRDITEERAREAQFRRAERMASVAPLLRGVCHELNNPLTSIKSFADLLLLDERPEEEREALEIVAREASRAARIVTDLRTVARQRQEASPHRTTVDVAAVAEQVVAARRDLIAAGGVVVNLDLDRTLPPAWAVREQVEQVVMHLLTNALQALRQRAQPRAVNIATFRGELGVVLQVSDTGPGIAPENLNRIFDPFWTTKSPGEGTGLGLSLVQSIVEDHGGRITLDSQLERGATFTVEFPTPHQTSILTESGIAERSAGRTLRILLADRETPIRTSLSRYLERRGHLVTQANDAPATLDALQQSTNDQSFDIIVADLLLQDLDGELLATHLCTRYVGLEQRLVFLAAADSPRHDLAARALDSGTPVIVRPFELAEVAQIIEAHAGMFEA
jgi:two-component system, NtrC family, sensor kinase